MAASGCTKQNSHWNVNGSYLIDTLRVGANGPPCPLHLNPPSMADFPSLIAHLLSDVCSAKYNYACAIRLSFHPATAHPAAIPEDFDITWYNHFIEIISFAKIPGSIIQGSDKTLPFRYIALPFGSTIEFISKRKFRQFLCTYGGSWLLLCNCLVYIIVYLMNMNELFYFMVTSTYRLLTGGDSNALFSLEYQ